MRLETKMVHPHNYGAMRVMIQSKTANTGMVYSQEYVIGSGFGSDNTYGVVGGYSETDGYDIYFNVEGGNKVYYFVRKPSFTHPAFSIGHSISIEFIEQGAMTDAWFANWSVDTVASSLGSKMYSRNVTENLVSNNLGIGVMSPTYLLQVASTTLAGAVAQFPKLSRNM